jgi:hypothetical protein
MMTSINVISTQIYNVKMTSSKRITKSKVRKKMAKYGFERKFHALKYFEHGFFFTFLKFMMNLKAPCKKRCRKSLIYCTFSLFWTNFFDFSKLSLYFQPLAPSLKFCINFFKIFLWEQTVGLCKSTCFLTFCKKEFQKN